jgi:predicted ribonuclease YlaK
MYKGYIEVPQNEDKYLALYNNINSNTYDCLVNQYVLVKDSDGQLVDRLRWDGNKYTNLSYKQVNNNYMGKIKPLNPQQELAFDLLQSKDITVKILTGRFGSGKTYLMIANALQLISDGKFDKIIWVRNNQEVKDTKAIGALPGDPLSKLLPFAMPIADHVGGLDGLEFLIKQDKVNIEHLGWIRGRSFENAIVMCSEAENLTKQHVQLLIGRIGKGSNLWLDGDFKQVDSKIFEENNGLNIAIDKLKGHRLFGYVNLEKSERSETAALADLLDE